MGVSGEILAFLCQCTANPKIKITSHNITGKIGRSQTQPDHVIKV